MKNMTIDEMKNDLLKTLDSMDKNKLSLHELRTYAEVLKTVSDIQGKSYIDYLTQTMSGVGFGYKAPTVSDLK